MMKKIIIILIVLAYMTGCICSGGGSDESVQKTGGQTTSETPQTTQAKGGVVESIKDMASAIASGGSYKCTYTVEGAKADIWIKGEKFKSTVKAQGMVFNSISDGEWAYIWRNGEKEGMKNNLDEMKQLQGDTQDQGQDSNSYQDIETIAKMSTNVDCRPDVLPASTFQPPAGIEFKDFGESMKKMQEELTKQMEQGQGMPDACSMCEMIPDAQAKQQCLQDCGG